MTATSAERAIFRGNTNSEMVRWEEKHRKKAHLGYIYTFSAFTKGQGHALDMDPYECEDSKAIFVD
jgi:hypothetical protein